MLDYEMAIFITNPATSRYLIVTPQRQKRHPQANAQATPRCPFCSGSEADTPPEVDRIGEGEPNTPGWFVRVVPNKYPITDIHEVIIHSPEHDKDISQLPKEHIHHIFTMYQRRLHQYASEGTCVLFCNAGKKAGISLSHPHSQLALLPPDIQLPQRTIEPIQHITHQTPLLTAYCPAFSEWPLETWITPTHDGLFETMTSEHVQHLSEFFPAILNNIKKVAHSPDVGWSDEEVPYNFTLINQNPWSIRIIPRIQIPAGFELATGIAVNSIDPSHAAELLKQAA